MHKKLFVSLTLLIGVAACQVVETPEPTSDRLTINITADPVYEDGMGPETKAVIHGTKMYWSPGDTLGVFPDRGSQVYFLVDSEGEAISAPFDGGAWEFKANSIYTSYYPLVGEFYLTPDRIPVQYYKDKDGEIKLQTQVGNDSSVHTSEYLYMYTDPQEVINGNISFAYHHLWTVLKPMVELPAGHYTKLTFSLDEPLFVEKGYFDLTSDAPAIIGTEFANEVSMNLDVTFDAPTTLTAYYATAPLDMQGKTLSITITEESGIEYTYTYNPSKAYKAGTTYRLASAESFVNDDIIDFADSEFKRICVENWDTNGDGELSYSEAAAVTSLGSTAPVTKVGEGGSKFAGSSITSANELAFFTGLTNIVDRAFKDCQSLMSVTFPETITSIGDFVFDGCSALITVNFKPLVPPTVGDGFLEELASVVIVVPEETIEMYLAEWSSVSGNIQPEIVTPDANNLIYYTSTDGNIVTPKSTGIFGANIVSNTYENGKGTITFDGDVTCIGGDGFSDCSTLKSISLPDSVTEIGFGVFRGTVLTGLQVPKSVTRIDPMCIIDTDDAVYTISVDPLNPVYDSRNGCNAVIETATNRLVMGTCSSDIPNTVTTIGSCAFYGCIYLTRDISLPESVTTIEDSAFQSSGLYSITIPYSVTQIGGSAFNNCDVMRSVTVYSTTPPTGGSGMFDGRSNYPIYVPAESVEAYKSAQYWSDYADRIKAIGTPVAVDLGLSVMWSSFNLGATRPEEYGDYYAWGEIESKDNYSSSNYLYSNGYYDITKYNTNPSYGHVDNKTELEIDDDAAYAKWGSQWRMPSLEEGKELINNCTWENTTLNGVNGYLVTSKINGNSIFLPTAGFWNGPFAEEEAGRFGRYWLSTLNDDPHDAWRISLRPLSSGSDYLRSWDIYDRYAGNSIRPVYGFTLVSGINLDNSTASLYVGRSITLNATLSPSNSTFKSLSWISSDESVATVVDGVVTALSKGSAIITVTAKDGSGVSAECLVTVKPVVPSGAVDLGLSVYWASCNIGASYPDEYGNYYSWGEIVTKDEYTEENYTYSNFPDTLPLDHDAAHSMLGGGWRIPTYNEWEELLDASLCSWEWTTVNNISGYKVTSKVPGYTDKWIFLPAAGFHLASLTGVGRKGYYWTSSSRNYFTAWYNLLCQDQSDLGLDYDSNNGYKGYSIRPVYY